IDTFAKTSGDKTFSFPGLPAGRHTVTVTVLGSKRAASTSTLVGLDGYTIDGVTTNTPPLTAGWSPVFGHVVTNHPGASLTLRFVGTGLTWNAFVGPNEGRARVTIDGDTVTQDLYAADFGFTDFTKNGLTPGAHTLRITVAGTKRVASANTIVAVNSIT